MYTSNTGGCLPTIRSYGTTVVPPVRPAKTCPLGGRYGHAAALPAAHITAISAATIPRGPLLATVRERKAAGYQVQIPTGARRRVAATATPAAPPQARSPASPP